MACSRRTLAFVLVPLLLAACGGPSSRLITVRSGTGSGEILFEVKNASDTPVNALFMAQTDAVNAADPDRLDGNSAAGEAVWGPDLLTTSAIGSGARRRIPVAAPGRWDVRAVARDDREQHVAGLKLDAGGRYILELNDGGWRVR